MKDYREPLTEMQANRLLVFTYYTSPWDRLGCWLMGIDRKTNSIVRPVADDGFRAALADWCDRRDRDWRNKWARRWPARKPPSWWKS
jgi:hypothetical protein